jgi:hypothetical protein
MQAVNNCRLSLNEFLEKVRKYERSLGDEGCGNLLRDSTRKIQWQVSRKDELAKVRVEVIAHCSSINMLTATAEV